MPVYSYKCEPCRRTFTQTRRIEDRHEPECTHKGCSARLVPSLVNDHTFKPFYHPDLDTQPVYIESKKQLKQECDKRGVRSWALD